MGHRKWDFIPWVSRVDDSCYPVSKKMTTLLRHHPELRDEDGAVEWRRLLIRFRRSYFSRRCKPLETARMDRSPEERQQQEEIRVLFEFSGRNSVHASSLRIFRRGRSRSQTAKQRRDTTRVDRLHLSLWSIIGLHIYCRCWFARWRNKWKSKTANMLLHGSGASA